MKINIAFLGTYNNQGIGGGDRKFGIYFKNLNDDYFNKYFIYLTENDRNVSVEGNEVILTRDLILDFLKEKNIDYVYFAGAKITDELQNKILKDHIGLINVNFTSCYSTNERLLNLIISKTDYWKLRWINGELKNSYVVYNPIDFTNWDNLSKVVTGIYRDKFINKKLIIGRLARAEPSKWHFLILATLWRLDKQKNYQYGFIFAGMSRIYRIAIKIFLSKKMQESILFLPELRKYEDIAKFYKSINIFWQTSWIGESFGNVIAEAFCFKVPVITDYKWFYKNGKVNKKLYDAQIELVDSGVNGIYGKYPDAIIRFLESTKISELKIMGENGYNKVKNIYNVEYTSNTMAKILYNYGRKNLGFEKDDNFEKLVQLPSDKEVQIYENEYGKRIDICYKYNTIGFFSKQTYVLLKNIWRFIEYKYLIIRKILFKLIKVNLEKF